jgi:hypothetical protein
VSYPETVTTDELLETVAAAGYAAELPPIGLDKFDQRGGLDQRENVHTTDPLLQRLAVSTVLGVPVIAMAMLPALQFTYWQWASLTLAAPGRGVGRVAVPHGCLGQPAARRHDDGHADLGRCARGVRLVAVCPVLR